MNRAADASDYFAGRNLALVVGGLVIRVVLAFLIPQDFLPEWRHTVGSALTLLSMGPWALNTIFREQPWSYALFVGIGIGVMALIEMIFRR
jgi:hypothetical protein